MYEFNFFQKSSSKYKDEDDDGSSEDEKLNMSAMTKPREWGGRFGTIFCILLLPVIILAPQLACLGPNKCKTASFRISHNWREYLDLKSTLIYAAYIFSIALTTLIPVGKLYDSLENKYGRLQFRDNGKRTKFLKYRFCCELRFLSENLET